MPETTPETHDSHTEYDAKRTKGYILEVRDKLRRAVMSVSDKVLREYMKRLLTELGYLAQSIQ